MTDALTLNSDVTANILLELDPQSLNEARLTCQFYYRLTQSEFFWKRKLQRDYGLAKCQVHELFSDEYRFLSCAPLENLLTVKRDDIALMRLLQIQEPTVSDANVAASLGRIDLLTKFEQKGVIPNSRALQDTVRRGHYEVVKWLEDHDIYIERDSSYYAAMSGNLELLKYTIDPYWDLNEEEHGAIAASYGHLNILEWMIGLGRPLPIDDYSEAAVCGDQVHVLDWLWDRGIMRPKEEWANLAVEKGHLKSLQWLLAHGIKFDPEWVEVATILEAVTSEPLRCDRLKDRYRQIEKLVHFKDLLTWLKQY